MLSSFVLICFYLFVFCLSLSTVYMSVIPKIYYYAKLCSFPIFISLLRPLLPPPPFNPHRYTPWTLRLHSSSSIPHFRTILRHERRTWSDAPSRSPRFAPSCASTPLYGTLTRFLAKTTKIVAVTIMVCTRYSQCDSTMMMTVVVSKTMAIVLTVTTFRHVNG